MAPHSPSHSEEQRHLLQLRRILMEEEEDHAYGDHPALLHVQQPFAQILSSSSTSTSTSLLPEDNNGVVSANLLVNTDDYNPDMFRAAFFKGMDDAGKFLPTPPKEKAARGHGVEDELDVCRAPTKVAAVEADTNEMLDQMMLHGFAIPMEEKASMNKCNKNKEAEAVDLHTLLLHCAKAVVDERRSAAELLEQIRQHASPTGDAVQRLGHCFAKGLEARLSGTGIHAYRSLAATRTSTADFLKAYQLFMSTCCFRKVAFTFANKAIFNAAAGRSRLHIVDYGLHHGFQWPELLQWLGEREGGPPVVRITHIDLPQSGFRPAKHMEEMGTRLSRCAHQFGVPFEFRLIVAPQWQSVCVDDINMEPDEVLTVNDLFNFRTLMDESVVIDSKSPRDIVLSNIAKMRPDVFVHGTVNGSHGITFLSRFREALFYHSAMFDMLDATMPRESQLRLVLEQDILGWVALNAIACEGEDRVERGETYKQWQVRNQRAGLRQLPLNRETLVMVTNMVKKHYHKDFVIEEDQQWLLQGWKGRILFAHSTWVAK
ncbi:scarecrow-like protein 33 [Oryza brachyantha]|uniref:scarecrow-like protein 33 n=1 Tax=Oryza brachyantha TaxID=4533 RepID=UPI001ADB89AF|nr:scarecrow-like protein 33 [Oryza brachyantha]